MTNKKKSNKKLKKNTQSLTHYSIIALMRGSHGLSARRARRTKSNRPEGPKAGPKGRSLEVRARRAPRLLVDRYFQKTMSDPLFPMEGLEPLTVKVGPKLIGQTQ